MAVYCILFDLNTKIYPGDRREGCCGICSNYDSINSKCKNHQAVNEWADTVKFKNEEPK